MDVNFDFSKLIENSTKYIFYFLLFTFLSALLSYNLLYARSKLQNIKEQYENRNSKKLVKEKESEIEIPNENEPEKSK